MPRTETEMLWHVKGEFHNLRPCGSKSGVLKRGPCLWRQHQRPQRSPQAPLAKRACPDRNYGSWQTPFGVTWTLSNLSIYGQESNQTTLRLAKMNLAIRGIDAQIEFGDSFRNDQHPDLRADYILANPPFNISEWNGDQLREDKRWVHGTPPVGNANFAWASRSPASPPTFTTSFPTASWTRS